MSSYAIDLQTYPTIHVAVSYPTVSNISIYVSSICTMSCNMYNSYLNGYKLLRTDLNKYIASSSKVKTQK